jgi:hypothetical protein
MKKVIGLVLVLLTLATGASASDSIALGVRAGSVTNHDGYFTEAFGDLYINRLVSLGATVAFTSVDHGIRRDKSVPVTALFKVHAPIPLIKPYAGLGAATVFHDHRGIKGTPVALVGLDLKLGLTPLFLNLEYRRQFDDKLDYLGGGVGVKF